MTSEWEKLKNHVLTDTEKGAKTEYPSLMWLQKVYTEPTSSFDIGNPKGDTKA